MRLVLNPSLIQDISITIVIMCFQSCISPTPNRMIQSQEQCCHRICINEKLSNLMVSGAHTLLKSLRKPCQHMHGLLGSPRMLMVCLCTLWDNYPQALVKRIRELVIYYSCGSQVFQPGTLFWEWQSVWDPLEVMEGASLWCQSSPMSIHKSHCVQWVTPTKAA